MTRYSSSAQDPTGADTGGTTVVPPYGAPLTLREATKIMVAAEAEATTNNWPVAIVIVDSCAVVVMIHKLDNTQHSTVDIAKGKALTAVNFRRPSKVFQDGIAKGGEGLRFLSLPGVTPLEGGLPIIVDGRLVGAIGVSGVLSTQDSQISAAGLKGLN